MGGEERKKKQSGANTAIISGFVCVRIKEKTLSSKKRWPCQKVADVKGQSVKRIRQSKKGRGRRKNGRFEGHNRRDRAYGVNGTICSVDKNGRFTGEPSSRETEGVQQPIKRITIWGPPGGNFGVKGEKSHAQ